MSPVQHGHISDGAKRKDLLTFGKLVLKKYGGGRECQRWANAIWWRLRQIWQLAVPEPVAKEATKMCAVR